MASQKTVDEGYGVKYADHMNEGQCNGIEKFISDFVARTSGQ